MKKKEGCLMAAKHKKKRPAAKKSSGRSVDKKKKTEKKVDSYQHSQGKAVVLFAVAVLLLFVVFIPARDAALWNAVHRLILGTFGICAVMVPVAIGYVAVTMALEKDRATVKRHIALSTLLVVILQALLEVFTAQTAGVTYGNAIAAAYRHGAGFFDDVFVNGGVIGSMIGFPMEALLSDIGAKITLVLLTIVIVMLITRATLMSLWRPIKKTAQLTREHVMKTRERLAEAVDEAEQQENDTPREVIVPASKIDIDLGDGYSETVPVKRDPKRVFEEAVDENLAEQERPQLRIDDIIGRAMEQKEATAPVVTAEPDDVLEPMTAEELKEAEEEVAKEIEQQPPAPVYVFPPTTLLSPPKPTDDRAAREEMQMNAELLVQTLKEFGISARVVDIVRGPSVTRYELQPNAGVKISRITGLADDIALRLATSGVRIEAPIPNKAAIGIEVPNKTRATVSLRELIESSEFTSQSAPLNVALGRDITGQIVTADLSKMPHVLVAGTTGSGKSVCTNSMIQSILFHSTPDDVRMILIDPKVVEFSIYNGIPHLLVPVVTNPRKAAGALGWAVTEMDRRYNTFAENNVRDIKSYNQAADKSDTLQKMP
ncbi:MAG: DUF87 domain-containing protein, partial [Clostridia bacterium]|nr:DUF87 domain-containing protein [Clostridia bacterium]